MTDNLNAWTENRTRTPLRARDFKSDPPLRENQQSDSHIVAGSHRESEAVKSSAPHRAPRIEVGQPAWVYESLHYHQKPSKKKGGRRRRVRARTVHVKPTRQQQRECWREYDAALARGELIPGPCVAENSYCHGRIDGHHHDYCRPLDVAWVCSRHHRVLDRKRRQGVPLEQAIACAREAWKPTGWFPTVSQTAPVPPPDGRQS